MSVEGGMKAKVATVFTLIALGVFQLVSGLVLYFTRGYGWGRGLGHGWLSYAEVERHVLKEYHFYCGLIITAIVVVHFALNWKIFMAELRTLKTKSRK